MSEIEAIKDLHVVRPWWLLPPGRLQPIWWVALGAVIIWVDHLPGELNQLPLLYALLVIMAAWYSGKRAALSLAIAVPLVRLGFLLIPESRPADVTVPVLMTVFRGTVIVFVALWFARLAQLERELDRKVRVLEELLPICSFCKSIRNETGQWERLESFVARRSDAQFSHGVCPSCGQRHYPGVLDEDHQPAGQ